MKEQVQESARQLAEVIGVLQTNSKSLMESQANNTQSVQNTVESSLEIILEAKELHSSYANLLSQTENAMKEIKPVTEHLIQTGAALKIGSDNLTKISNNLLQQMQNFNLSSQQTLKELQSSLEQSKITLREYADKFSIIDRGLKGIFEQIQSGLSSYQATTKESINRYLQEFTSQFVQAVKSISGATESLAENTEQLSDVFETILKKFQGK
jgi:ABC-type transporter Mla subunit MlaD